MLSTRTRLKVLCEMAEDEEAEMSAYVTTSEEEVLQHEAKRERRRRKIIKELFETEKAYLYNLDLVHRYFYFPLQFNGIITDDVHAKLFSNLEQLLEVNRELLEYMEQTTPGQAFKFFGPFLKLYSTYANNHVIANATVQDLLQKSTKFVKFIQQQESREELKGLKLNALLITPVQRIPRYKLLLEDLLQNTLEDHHDYLQLKEAAKEIGLVAIYINEHIKQHENFHKMLTIQNSFDKSAPKILAPGRQFIMEGPLKKVPRRGGKFHERMFFLFSDILIYGKPKFIESGSRSYSCCCVLPLRHCQLERIFTTNAVNKEAGGMFKVTCKDESLLLYSDDKDDAIAWIEALEQTIRKCNVNRQTLRKPSSDKIPLRGKSLRMKRKEDKQQDPKQSRFQSVQEDGECSPCHSMKRKISELELSNCLTPNKKPKQDDDKDACFSPKQKINNFTKCITPLRRMQLRSSSKIENMREKSQDTFQEPAQDSVQDSDSNSSRDFDNDDLYQECQDNTSSNSVCNDSQSTNYDNVDVTAVENALNFTSYVTMEDLETSTVSLEGETSCSREIQTEPVEIYYPGASKKRRHSSSIIPSISSCRSNSTHDNKSQSVLTHPGRVYRRCRRLVQSAGNRISNRAQKCCIQ